MKEGFFSVVLEGALPTAQKRELDLVTEGVLHVVQEAPFIDNMKGPMASSVLYMMVIFKLHRKMFLLLNKNTSSLLYSKRTISHFR